MVVMKGVMDNVGTVYADMGVYLKTPSWTILVSGTSTKEVVKKLKEMNKALKKEFEPKLSKKDLHNI